MTLYLREWRDARGLSLDTAASHIGVHLSTLQKWEKGLRAPGPQDLERVAQVYGIHPAALFFHPDDKDKAARLTRAHALLDAMAPEMAEQWLRLAETMAPREPAPEPGVLDAT
jgi:transcriptional regulator with XRE-family HTH domain